MDKWRSLAIISLGLACLLVTACETTGTPGKSAGAGGTQATSSTSAQARATQTQSQAAAQRQAQTSRQAASRSGTSSAGARPVISALQKGIAGGTLKNIQNLYTVITGRKIDATTVVDGAIAAAAVLLGIGAFATVRVVRHRRLTPSTSAARR